MSFIEKLAAQFGFVKSKPGDWAGAAAKAGVKPAAVTRENDAYDADAEMVELATSSVKSPCGAFLEALREGKATVAEAYLFAGRFSPDGKLLRSKLHESLKGTKDYTIQHVRGTEAFKAIVDNVDGLLEARRKTWEDRCALREATKARAIEAGLLEDDSFDFDSSVGMYDPAQYTEYTPLMGGPHFKQLYLYDYLSQHSKAFELWNHHPVAKRVINIMAQYTLGRGYKAMVKNGNEKQQKAWDKFELDNSIKRKVTRFWVREFLIYGELMVDKVLWQSIDPSTVWDIITDPDNVDDVYYYHQQYPTAYAQFTGKQVPGVPGSADQKAIEYIVRQLPFDRVLHIKSQVVSNEKRGRSWLFPIQGWLKRIRDLYNARVIGEWLRASFIWDDTIDGSDADVSAHLSAYAGMPSPGSIFAHNKAIERKALSPANAQGAQNDIGAEIMALIATSIGIPKEHLNVNSQGGSRATALTSAEPFTKVVEEIQAEFEDLLQRIAAVAMEQAGVEYEQGDIEFIFPSVTKDTTSETVKNIMAGEASGYIAKDTAGNMYAAELNITGYDFEDEQTRVKKLQADEVASGVMPPASRQPGVAPELDNAEGGSEIQGQGRLQLKNKLTTL